MKGLNNKKELLGVLALSMLAAVLFLAFCTAVRGRSGVLEIYRKGTGEAAPEFYSGYVRDMSLADYSRTVNLMVHHYLRAGFPVPGHFPSHTIERRTLLQISSPGHYGFRLDASHPAELFIDGKKALSGPGELFIPLHPGERELVLRFFNDDGERGRNLVNRQIQRGREHRGIPAGRFGLAWNAPGGRGWEPVPGIALRRPGGSPRALHNMVMLSLLAAGAAMVLSNPGLYRRFFRENSAGIAMACIFALGLALRVYEHAAVPVYIETMDEIGCGWSGWSIINWGVPVNWSLLFEAYGPRRPAVSWFGVHFNIVSPYFDHPPLFHIVAGAAAMLGGARELLQVSVSSMRIVPVILSSSVVVLLYGTLKRHYSRRIALLAAFLYAIVPTIVVSGRIVQEDNMMAPLVILALFFYSKSLDKGRWQASIPVGLALGLASLAKFPAVAFIGAFSFLYLIRGRWKSALAVFGLGGALSMLYFAYGAWIDWEMFLRVFGAQSGKIPQLALPIRMAFQPKLLEMIFWDGGIMFLWFSVLSLCFVERGKFSRDIGILFCLYFILISVSVIYDRDYGWYRIMMFPFLSVAGALALNELIKTKSVLLMVFFLGFAVMLNLQAILPAGVAGDVHLPKLLAAAFILPVLPVQVWDTKKWRSVAVITVLAAIAVYAVTSIIMVINFAQIYYGEPFWSGVL